MHPVLLQFGKVTVYTYGFLIAVGFIVGIFCAKTEAARRGQNPEMVMDLSFYIIIAAIVGSRLFYALTTPEVYLKDPLEFFKIWNGGLVFYGGFIMALLAAILYVYVKGLKVWETADIFAPAIAIGQFFGRLGCFSAGCCYGKLCELPWALTFQHPDSLAPTGLPLHPTQLYHAGSNLLIFLLLWNMRKKTRFPGQLFWTYVSVYGAVRAFLETFRNDFRGQLFLETFSVSQVIGVLMAITGITMLAILSRKND